MNLPRIAAFLATLAVCLLLALTTAAWLDHALAVSIGGAGT